MSHKRRTLIAVLALLLVIGVAPAAQGDPARFGDSGAAPGGGPTIPDVGGSTDATTFTVNLEDHLGNPVTDGCVTAYDQFYGWVADSCTGPGGAYSLSIPDGTGAIRIEAYDALNQWWWFGDAAGFALATAVSPAAGSATIAFPERLVFTVDLEDSVGSPITDACVTATDPTAASVTIDFDCNQATGTYGLAIPVGYGSIKVSATWNGNEVWYDGALEHGGGATVDPTGGPLTFTFPEVTAYTVHLQDDASAPITDACVELLDSTVDTVGYECDAAGGDYSFDLVAVDGDVKVVAYWQGMEVWYDDALDIDAASAVTPADGGTLVFAFPAVAEFTVHLQDHLANPVTNGCVYAYSASVFHYFGQKCNGTGGDHVFTLPMLGDIKLYAYWDGAETWHDGADTHSTATPVPLTNGGSVVVAFPELVPFTVDVVETGGTPVTDACVYLFDLSETLVDSTCNGAGGVHEFVVDAAVGPVKINVYRSGLDLWYGGTSFATATAVDLAQGAVEFEIATSLSFTVHVEESDATPITGGCVNVYEVGSGSALVSTCLDTNGAYGLEVPAGTGDIEVRAQWQGILVWYDGELNRTDATAITPTDGGSVTITFPALATHTISVEEYDGTPVTDACVYIDDLSDNQISGTCTNTGGDYEVLVPTTDEVKVRVYWQNANWWYDGATDAAWATPLTLGDGGSTTVTLIDLLTFTVHVEDSVGAPVDNACVAFYNSISFDRIGLVCGGSGGDYTTAIPAAEGDIKVRADWQGVLWWYVGTDVSTDAEAITPTQGGSVTLAYPELATFTVVSEHGDGAPAEEACVYAYKAATPALLTASCAKTDGVHSLTVVAGIDVKLKAEWAGRFTWFDDADSHAAADALTVVGGELVTINLPDGSFHDVPWSHPFFVEIEWMAAEGISTGYGDGSFRPSADVSRQAMSAFMYRLAGEPAFSPPGTPSFTDVPVSHPFFVEIEWMAAEGISTGYGDGSFRPSADVSRQAMSAFMYRLEPLLP